MARGVVVVQLFLSVFSLDCSKTKLCAWLASDLPSGRYQFLRFAWKSVADAAGTTVVDGARETIHFSATFINELETLDIRSISQLCNCVLANFVVPLKYCLRQVLPKRTPRSKTRKNLTFSQLSRGHGVAALPPLAHLRWNKGFQKLFCYTCSAWSTLHAWHGAALLPFIARNCFVTCGFCAGQQCCRTSFTSFQLPLKTYIERLYSFWQIV